MNSSLFYNYIQDIRGPFDQLDHISILRKTVVAHRTTCKLHLRVTIWYQKLQNRVYVWGALLNFFLHPVPEKKNKRWEEFLWQIFLEHVHKSALAWCGIHSLSFTYFLLAAISYFFAQKILISHTTPVSSYIFRRFDNPYCEGAKGYNLSPSQLAPYWAMFPSF